MAAIAQGPVSVTIDASQTVFHAYTSGIITGTACGTSLDHAVVAVGYGTDAETGLDYYLIRNSWGAAWGLSGHFWLPYDYITSTNGLANDFWTIRKVE